MSDPHNAVSPDAVLESEQVPAADPLAAAESALPPSRLSLSIRERTLDPASPDYIPPELLFSTFARCQAIRAEISRLQLELKRLIGERHLRDVVRECECLRCGYCWTPYNPFSPPASCARCGSTAWMMPPTEKSRKPSDRPSPSWRKRKNAKRRPKFRVMRPTQEGEPAWKRGSAAQATTTQPSPASLRDRMAKLRAEMQADAAAAVASAVLPPPPPLPSSRLPSLSEHLARLAQQEPQPERVASHSAPAMPVEDSPDEMTAADYNPAEEADDAADALEPDVQR